MKPDLIRLSLPPESSPADVISGPRTRNYRSVWCLKFIRLCGGSEWCSRYTVPEDSRVGVVLVFGVALPASDTMCTSFYFPSQGRSEDFLISDKVLPSELVKDDISPPSHDPSAMHVIPLAPIKQTRLVNGRNVPIHRILLSYAVFLVSGIEGIVAVRETWNWGMGLNRPGPQSATKKEAWQDV